MKGVYKSFGDLDKYKSLTDDSFLIKLFPTYAFNIKTDELDEFYLVDSCTGECYPIYQVLPCGKCTVCRYKKTQQWMTRAFAENCTSQHMPLFITLTMNDYSYPPCGLLKEYCQAFMKRLRKRLSDYGYTENLRFFLVGEYGSKTGRAHYHLLLWNFPSMDFREMRDYIEDAWSNIVDEETYLKLPKDFKFIEISRKWNLGKKCFEPKYIYRQRIGFVYPLYVSEGAASYVMKYMRKEQVVPDHCVKPFQLYSRRKGIGYQWLEDNKEFFLENPDVLDVKMYDKWTDSEYTAQLPSYYVHQLYPSRSRVIPKELRDSFKDWCYYGNALNILRKYFGYDLRPLDVDILEKFDMLTPETCSTWKDLRHELLCRHTSKIVEVSSLFPYPTILSAKYVYKFDDYLLTRIFNDYTTEYKFLSEFLRNYPLDKVSYNNSVYLKSMHDMFISEFVSLMDPVDVDEFSDYLTRRMYAAQRKEIF